MTPRFLIYFHVPSIYMPREGHSLFILVMALSSARPLARRLRWAKDRSAPSSQARPLLTRYYASSGLHVGAHEISTDDRRPPANITSLAAVARILDSCYPSRDRYSEHMFRESVRAAHRLQPKNPDASKVKFCNGPCVLSGPTNGVPPVYVAFRHF